MAKATCPGVDYSGIVDAINKPPTLDKYVLLQDINWFGRIISAGTVYHQVNADYYHPIIDTARCPSLQIDFYTVKNNSSYFLKII